MLTNLLNTIRY